MIREIVNFVNDLPQKTYEYKNSLEEGLYWIVGRNKNGSLEILEKRNYKSKQEKDTIMQWCEKVQQYVVPVSPQKIFNPNKKIFGRSCSAFALYFNNRNLFNKKVKAPYSDEVLKDAMKQYFKSAKAYCEKDEHKNWASEFESYCLENLIYLLAEEDFEKSKANFVIHVVFNEPTLADYEEIYEIYMKQKIFNKDKYNIKARGMTYGISDNLSSFSDKKMFWKHKTAPFEFNYRVTSEIAKALWHFFKLRSREVLPNPLPIFIDKRELNEKVVAIVNEDKTSGYSEILKKLFEDSRIEVDLGGYYLLFFKKNKKGPFVVDFDLVPAFRYHLDITIERLFKTRKEEEKGTSVCSVKNVFEFEKLIANRIFDGQLIAKKKNWLKYFDDIDYNPKYISQNTYTQLLKHRKAFYDFIYKSRQEAIQSHAFHEIMISGILDLIHRDNKLDQDCNIKEKMNIWFSLYDYFNNSQINSSDMVNKTQNMVKRMREITNEGVDDIFHDDDEFAFASGQLIRYLLSHNESTNRTHALLEPFLQKVEPKLFKLAIARTFDTYKHALKFYKGKDRYAFDRIMSAVMGAEPDNGNMKDHLPMILAGYFAKSVFYDDSSNPTTNS